MLKDMCEKHDETVRFEAIPSKLLIM